MTDPLDVLRLAMSPTDPDPAFAARLRRRIERELTGEEHPVTSMTDAPSQVRALTLCLAVAGARRALEWYADAFGAVPLADPILMPDGRVGHAEMRIGAATVYLADEYPENGFVGPQSRGGSTVTLVLDVADSDETVERAVAAGAEFERPGSTAP